MKENHMASNSLIPLTSRALVPNLSRKHLAVLESVYGAALRSAAFMDAAEHLAHKGSDALTELAIIHEAQIRIAPLADEGLAEIRRALGAVAKDHILQMRGQM
jgi:hypothetical protein